jgi:hypothetical protein
VPSPSRRGWWILLITALIVVFAWPPQEDRSLGVKFVNWIVDPGNDLPVLPPQLEAGMGDDPYAVELRDAVVQRYDDLYDRGWLTRARLEYKVARDPFNPSTERQVLLVLGVVVAFLVWRFEGR